MTMLKLNHRHPFLFENFINESDYLSKSNFKSLPSVNVIEKTDGFTLEVAAPGLKKDDFKISFHNNKLTISSEKVSNTDETAGKYTRKEFSYNQFQRSFSLPQTIDSEKISANYQDGILNINVPIKEEAKDKGVKTIEIA